MNRMTLFNQEYIAYCIHFSKVWAVFEQNPSIVDSIVEDVDSHKKEDKKAQVWIAPSLRRLYDHYGRSVPITRISFEQNWFQGFSRVGLLQMRIFNDNEKTIFEVKNHILGERFLKTIHQNNMLMPFDMHLQLCAVDHSMSVLSYPLTLSIVPCKSSDPDMKSWYDVGDGVGYLPIRIDVPLLTFYDEEDNRVGLRTFLAATRTNIKRHKNRSYSYTLYANQYAGIYQWARFTTV